MAMRKHVHEEVFPASPPEVFALLHTPSAIRQWWGAARAVVMAREGGIWAAVWGDDEDAPDYMTTARMRIFDPPRRLVFTDYEYFAKSGPLPFQAEFTTEFTVRLHAEGSILRVEQDGFPAESFADPFFAACEQGWRDTFAGIRRYLADSGKS